MSSKSKSIKGLCSSLAVPDSDHDPLSARQYSEPSHSYRSAFARDGARILHAKAFRRLAGKTQVFTRRAQESDHSRSRLTHTLEVAQIARTVASTLGLNSPLSEALALVHDIGHPPFGHAGEEALNRALQKHGLSFDHNLHALRIVTSFEERYAAFPGLNLTFAVREGIIKHSHNYSPAQHPELVEYLLDQQPPLEAQLIDVADEIAYLTADLEDGLAAGVLTLQILREQVPFLAGFYQTSEQDYPTAQPRLLIHEALKQMLNAMVGDLMHSVADELASQRIETLEELRQAPARIAHLSLEIEAKRKQTKSFLYANLYQSPSLEIEHTHAEEVIQTLFGVWTANPSLLPPDHQARIHQEGTPRAVADYIAGMTDSYIEQAWQTHLTRS